jgi:peptidoglycan hydrolase-like protein with peptidoglycan-binding domain
MSIIRDTLSLKPRSLSRSSPAVKPAVTARPPSSQGSTSSASSFTGASKANTLVSPPATRWTDPNADALLGLERGDKRTGTGDRRIEQLHQDLMGLGYLPSDFTKNDGYGKNFGPMTESAVRRYQGDLGIPQTGVVDERTVAALAGRPIPPPPAAEHPEALIGLQHGDVAAAGDTRIAELHQNLMDRGYFPPSFASNSGFGKRYGDMTEAAVEHFQRDWGLTPTGMIDEATAAALGSHGTAPGPELRGAWAGHTELGGASSPALSGTDGSLSQDFEHGRITKAADGTITVSDASGQVLETRTTRTVSSVDEANHFFVNQEGNTQYFQSFNGSAKPYGANDCGPTSAVIAAAALGLTEHPSAAEAPHAIDAMRDTIFHTNTTTSTTMGMGAVQQGLAAYGADTAKLDVSKATKDGAGLEAIDTALEAGHPVILGGTPGEAWAKGLNQTHDYLDMGKRGDASFGHFVTVLGKTPEGKYLVADPLSKQGTIEVSAAQIGTFLEQSGWGEAIEVYPAGKP